MKATLLLGLVASICAFGATRFEQSDTGFCSRGRNYLLDLRKNGEARLRIGNDDLRLIPRHASRRLQPVGVNRSRGQVNSFVGTETRLDIPTFDRVRYAGIYRGIDLIYYGRDGELEFDFVVKPGADPSLIDMEVSGGALSLDQGELVIGSLRWRKPVVYQADGKRVDGRFVMRSPNRVGFQLASYDHTKTLVIDPALSYLTYAGGSGNEAARGIAIDAQGNVYITGYTTSDNLPGTGGTVQSTYGGGIPSHQSTGDAFVAKYTPAGALVYMTYLGGNADDVGIGIAVDAQGNAYVTGYTNSTNFRTTGGAYQPNFGGQGRNSQYHEGGDAFVAKLNASGNQLLYSTYLGGSRDDRGIAIAIDAQGNAYVAGNTISTNFPVTAGAVQTTYGGGTSSDIYDAGDAFVCKLNPSGSQLLFSTYLGGSGGDTAGSIAADATGVYVGGKTNSANFPVTGNAAQKSYGGGADDSAQPIFKLGDGFLAKLNPGGTALIYSTYLGGSRDDAVTSIAVDSTGALYATGTTSSTNFPVTPSAAQKTYGGPAAPAGYLLFGDAFAVKLTPLGSIAYATYIGGTGDDVGWAIAVDQDGNALIGGQTNSTDLKVTADAVQKMFGGRGGQSQATGDGMFAKVNASGSAISYLSYFGGNGDDAIAGVALDANGDAWLTGSTMSTNLAATGSAPQKSFGGRNNAGLIAGDAFLAKITGLTPVVVPDVSIAAVANAASYSTGSVSPGEIVVIYGTKIGPPTLTTAVLNSAGLVDSTLSSTRVYFDGTPAPMVYASAGQSAAIVPYGVAGKSTTQIVAEYQGVKSLPVTLKVVEAAPGLFSADSTGAGQGAIYNEDNTLNTPTNPASGGHIVVLFGTGEGQTIPAGIDGKVATDVYPKPVLDATVTIGGAPAEILYAGAVPYQVAGLFQINVRVPQGLKPGDKEVLVSFGSGQTQKKLTVAVQ